MDSATRTFCRVAVVAFLLGAAAAQARAVELITNGNFETGTFAGWTTLLQSGSNGGFFIDAPGTQTPTTNGAGQTYEPYNTDQNSNEGTDPDTLFGGNFYAVSTSSSGGSVSGNGTRILYTMFTVPTGTLTSATLRFNYFVGNPVGPNIVGTDGGLLDYTTTDPFDPAQRRHFARIDLLRGTATNLFSTATVANGGEVIRNFFLGGGIANNTDPWKWQNGTDTNTGSVNPGTNVLANLQSGQTYILRFAEVSNAGPLNLGVDNVSLDVFFTAALPEPGTLPLMLLGGMTAGLAVVRRRRRGAR